MERDNRLGEYLRARREQMRPADFGLPGGGRRRVPGLRREEIAMLAGLSADYYVRLEQGRDKNPSEQVIESLARVFALTEDAHVHLRSLARPMIRRQRPRSRPERVNPELSRLLNMWSATPAKVLGRYFDVLAANPLAEAINPCAAKGTNEVRVIFLDPQSRELYPDWATIAADSVASLRASAGSDQDDPRLTDLVGELSVKSDDFRRLWARHDVRAKTAGVKQFIHPQVGALTLNYETFSVNGSGGQTLVVYHPEPASATAEALDLLASIVAPPQAPVRQINLRTTG